VITTYHPVDSSPSPYPAGSPPRSRASRSTGRNGRAGRPRRSRARCAAGLPIVDCMAVSTSRSPLPGPRRGGWPLPWRAACRVTSVTQTPPD